MKKLYSKKSFQRRKKKNPQMMTIKKREMLMAQEMMSKMRKSNQRNTKRLLFHIPTHLTQRSNMLAPEQ